MYSYITPYDAGRSDEGNDSEESSGMGDLFDSPSDDQTTFDMDPDRPFALDGTGQFTLPTAKRLSAPRLVESPGTGLLADVETIPYPNEDGLPDPPEGQKWRYVGPNKSGEGYDYETVPSSVPAPAQALAPVLDTHGFMDMVKRNKVVVGASAAATIGALWWLFLRKRA